jgi:hypothetical protein
MAGLLSGIVANEAADKLPLGSSVLPDNDRRLRPPGGASHWVHNRMIATGACMRRGAATELNLQEVIDDP